MLVAGCGTPLLATSIPTTDATLAQVRRGGEAMGCHELPSEVFRLYLVCPDRDVTLGVMNTSGELGFACPDLRLKKCRRFVAEVRRAGGVPPEEAEP